MNKLIVIISIFLFSNISYAACSWVGNTGTAASLSSTDISACVTDASSKTGEVTINLPAGSISSTGTVTVNMVTGFANVTSLSIIGDGAIPSLGSAESSVINRGTSGNIAFNVTGSSAKKFRISNIKFTGGKGWDALVTITGSSKPSAGGGFRIDHCTFGDVTNPPLIRCVRINGYTYGVIDHNSGITKYQFALVTEGVGGNPSWHRALSIGTSNAVYLEDNTIENKDPAKEWMICDAYDGGRIVIRYNTLYSFYIGQHDASSNGRGVVQVEAYKNVIDLRNGQTGADPQFDIRGGTYMVYDNVMTTSSGSLWGPPIYLRNYRSDATLVGVSPPWTDKCDTTLIKICAGTLVAPVGCTSDPDKDCNYESGACVNIDGNEVATNNGYPCRDQIGIAPSATAQQTHYPSLFWNNKSDGVYVAPSVRTANATHIQNNRDFCHSSTAMPASCNGIATLYNGEGYAYPHPLTGGTDTSAPVVNNTTPSTFECDASSPVDIALTRTTDEAATCRYALAPEEDWADMTEMATTGTTSHSQTLSLACGASYTYNVKCQDAAENTSINSPSSFSIAEVATDTTAPELSNPQPSGSVACGASSPVSKTLSLTCTDAVGCTGVKCDTESGIDIDSMDISLSQSGTTWSATVADLACNTVHTYYCKAEDTANNESASDTTISFSITAAASVVEAESGTLVAPVASAADATASGGYYIASDTNYTGTATYSVNIATAGYYQLIGVFNCLDAGEDSWYFAIDGGSQQTWYLGGAYGAWVQRTFGTNQLFSTTGNKSVVFTAREANSKFDWFIFSLLSCAEGQRQYCISQGDCEGVGGVWTDGVCEDPAVTPSGNTVIRVRSGSGDGTYKATGRTMRPY